MIELTNLLFVYAAIVLGAVGMAAFARERGQAMICASALCVSWMVGLASWTPYSVEQFLTGEHTLSTHASAWAVMDTFCAVVTLMVARYTWWGPLLFGFLFAGCLNDTLLWAGFTKWKSFSGVADAMFLAEEAIFFAIGANGCADLVSRTARRIGLPALHKRLVSYRFQVSE